jgi:uncharacterized membrane protein
MTKNRMEALSDGIFAIAMTILVLELKIPAVEAGQLPAALLAQAPKLLAFGLSFLIIGMYWVAHHSMTHFVSTIDRSSLWLNLGNLFVICFLPYPTGLLGEYPGDALAIILYATTLILVNLSGTLFWLHATALPDNARAVTPRVRRAVALLHMAPVLLDVLAIACAAVLPAVSYAVFVLIPLFFILPNPILKRLLASKA